MDSTQLSPPPAHKPRSGAGPSRRGETAVYDDAFRDGAAEAEHDRIDLNVPPVRRGWMAAAAILAVLALVALLLVGLLPRIQSDKELAADANAEADAPVMVNVVKPGQAPVVMNVRLPGTLRPWQEVSLFARTTGYLRKFDVDISNQVAKGQLMAEIDAPEVDAQLRGAQATLQQQQATAAKATTDFQFAESTLKRYQAAGTSITQQELDSYRANHNSTASALRSAQANVAAGEAEVKRLSDMQSFEKLTAPFSGVVTGRAYDVGAMILANPTTTDTMPLFKIAENDVLRAFVYVPQTYALTIHKGMEVKLTARELPGRVFTGMVLGTTNYLDPAARSLMTEVKIPNADLTLLPGMYVDATFEVKRDHPPLIIPASALVYNADGNQVGIVRNGKLHFQKVEVGVDYGNEIEVVAGLKGDELIVGNPGGRTVEGAAVRIVGQSPSPVAPK